MLMKIELPKRASGAGPELPESTRCLVVIGANGAGKTRFAAQVARAAAPELVFPLSPLRALFGAYRPDDSAASVDALYARALERSPLTVGRAGAPETEAERLMALMLQEEMTILLGYKMEGARGPLPQTKIDRVLALWREIFPENEILRHEGSILFASRDADASRHSAALSAGEKLVLYYFGAVLYAPGGALIPVESPEMFLHPSTLRRVWDRVEALRPDCTFVYSTHDLDFASTRTSAATVWVRSCNPEAGTFDYEVLPPDSEMREEMYLALLGARRPVLFIEGDATHSIDSKLYPLIFPDYTVRPLGSCDRVIESTRVFNSLGSFHHLDSMGIVDRDRRTAQEIAYLRRKKILVPEVAEIENMMMLPEVVRAVARSRKRDPERAFEKVKSAVIALFRSEMRQQALQHTRHQVKHIMEHRIDGRFASISKLEEHLADLVDVVNPRAIYEGLCREFHDYVRRGDYPAILRVYNQKSMIGQSNVAPLTGTTDRHAYIAAVLDLLKSDSPEAPAIRRAIRAAIR